MQRAFLRFTCAPLSGPGCHTRLPTPPDGPAHHVCADSEALRTSRSRFAEGHGGEIRQAGGLAGFARPSSCIVHQHREFGVRWPPVWRPISVSAARRQAITALRVTARWTRSAREWATHRSALLRCHHRQRSAGSASSSADGQRGQQNPLGPVRRRLQNMNSVQAHGLAKALSLLARRKDLLRRSAVRSRRGAPGSANAFSVHLHLVRALRRRAAEGGEQCFVARSCWARTSSSAPPSA